jgi:hypothetical protein
MAPNKAQIFSCKGTFLLHLTISHRLPITSKEEERMFQKLLFSSTRVNQKGSVPFVEWVKQILFLSNVHAFVVVQSLHKKTC